MISGLMQNLSKRRACFARYSKASSLLTSGTFMLEKEYDLIINYDKCHKGQSFSKTLLAVLTYIYHM